MSSLVPTIDLHAAARDFKMRHAKAQPVFRPKGRYKSYLLRTASRHAFVMTLIMMDAARMVVEVAQLMSGRDMTEKQAFDATNRALSPEMTMK